jgi:hypothetical protein
MERNSNKGLKKLVLLLLLFVGLGASVTAGAYWASSFSVTLPSEATGTVTVEVGEGKIVTVITELNAETTGNTDVLIPSNITPGAGETISKSFTVTATWSTETAGTVGIIQNGTISVVEDSVVITGLSDEDDADLFHVTITPESSTIQLGSQQAFTVTVTMSEPVDEAQYLRVANAVITITFSLEVVLA